MSDHTRDVPQGAARNDGKEGETDRHDPYGVGTSPFRMSRVSVVICVALLVCALWALARDPTSLLYLTFLFLSASVYFLASPGVGGVWIDDVRYRIRKDNVPILRDLLFVRKE